MRYAVLRGSGIVKRGGVDSGVPKALGPFWGVRIVDRGAIERAKRSVKQARLSFDGRVLITRPWRFGGHSFGLAPPRSDSFGYSSHADDAPRHMSRPTLPIIRRHSVSRFCMTRRRPEQRRRRRRSRRSRRGPTMDIRRGRREGC